MSATKEELDATAAERAAFLEEEQHVIAGVPIKQLLDKPEPYHAGALTPAYHVPGNVLPDIDPNVQDSSAPTLDAEIETKEYRDGTTATGVAPLPDQSPAQKAEQEQPLGNA